MKKLSDVNSNQLAIIVAFYLSKFDKAAKTRLGFKTDAEAFREISRTLGVEKNYIKFRRDEFDPIHPWRKGWQRPMDKRIIRSIEALQDLSEQDLGGIVEKIITDVEYRNGEEVESITHLLIEEKKHSTKNNGKFVLRGPTGKKAEEFFINYYEEGRLPFEGHLEDTRDMGCGYDFKVCGNSTYYFEVKGLAQIEGGILFTNKEWTTAQQQREKYFLVVIRDLDATPEIKIYQNPASNLSPKKNLITTLQVQWSLSEKQLNHD